MLVQKGLDIYVELKHIFLENDDGCSTHPHNTYIQILTSNGVIGFSLLIIAFLYLLIEIFRSKKKINHKNNLIIIL